MLLRLLKNQILPLWPRIEPLVRERLAKIWDDPDAALSVLGAIFLDHLSCWVVTTLSDQADIKAVILASIEDDQSVGRRYILIQHVAEFEEPDEELAEDAGRTLHQEAAARACSGFIMLGGCNWLYRALGLRVGCCSFGPVRHEVEGE